MQNVRRTKKLVWIIEKRAATNILVKLATIFILLDAKFKFIARTIALSNFSLPIVSDGKAQTDFNIMTH